MSKKTSLNQLWDAARARTSLLRLSLSDAIAGKKFLSEVPLAQRALNYHTRTRSIFPRGCGQDFIVEVGQRSLQPLKDLLTVIKYNHMNGIDPATVNSVIGAFYEMAKDPLMLKAYASLNNGERLTSIAQIAVYSLSHIGANDFTDETLEKNILNFMQNIEKQYFINRECLINKKEAQKIDRGFGMELFASYARLAVFGKVKECRLAYLDKLAENDCLSHLKAADRQLGFLKDPFITDYLYADRSETAVAFLLAAAQSNDAVNSYDLQYVQNENELEPSLLEAARILQMHDRLAHAGALAPEITATISEALNKAIEPIKRDIIGHIDARPKFIQRLFQEIDRSQLLDLQRPLSETYRDIRRQEEQISYAQASIETACAGAFDPQN